MPAEDDFYRVLCEHAAVALVATDEAFRIVAWNAAATDLLGRSAEDMIGRDVTDAVPDKRRKTLHRLLERTAERRQTSWFSIRLPDANGQTRDLMVILSPIPADDGASRGVAAWIVDETQRKQLSDRLAEAEKMASLGTLASGVAHHFNNILGGVATYVDFALSSGDATAMKRALQMTSEAAGRASRITQQLLTFAKQDTHRTDLADLTEVVLTFVHLVEHPLADKGVELQLDIRPARIVAVEANRMHQVLGNLLTNAEEAMPDGGTLTLGVRPAGKEVELTFADSGTGIPPDQLAMVFEPFFTTKGLHSGGEKANPGLGLSVAHGLVTEMGGRIAVDSTPGQGTTFTLAFPIENDEDEDT
ncbi:MAG: PAS domain S-box protein [Phycisphaerae bacterium]|nr:PAS domain S-box protein [Phycisphaerae bacterium]